MGKSPFAFILPCSTQGSERSCLRPARKLHLKLALWSEWLISHLEGMKVNERGKETAFPLLYIHHRRVSVRMSCLPPAMGSQRRSTSHEGSKMEASVHFLWPQVHVWINPRSLLFSSSSVTQPLVFSRSYCCKWLWLLVCLLSGSEWKSLNFTDLGTKMNRIMRWLSL